MLRSFLALAFLGMMLALSGCSSSPEYPFSEDFSKEISSPWKVEQDGLKVETANGELHISGTTAQGGYARSGVKTDDLYPVASFSASVDFSVPKFTGKGVPLVYLIAHSQTGYRGVYYYARFQEGYKLQVWNDPQPVAIKSKKEPGHENEVPPGSLNSMTEMLPAIGDEKNVKHRMRLDYDSQTKKVTGYIDDQLIGSADGGMSGPIGFELCISSNESGMAVDAYYDNFSVVSPPPPPPAASSTAKKTAPPPPPVENSNTETKNATKLTEPEIAILKLKLAIAKKDRLAIEKNIVSNPDSPLLRMFEIEPARNIPDLESGLKKGLSKLRRMEVGDQYPVSKEKVWIVAASEITPDQIPFQEIEAPFTMYVAKRLGGEWKVDVSILLESLKASLLEKSAEVQLEAPEDAIVQFMVAMMKGDKEGIENSIVPNPESAILLQGQHLPENAVPVLEAELRIVPYNRLKAGDSFSLGNGKKHVIKTSEITEDRLMINQVGSPLPFVLVRSNGVWKVDAGPIIAGRKAAAGKQ